MSFVLLGILNSQAAGGADKYFISSFSSSGSSPSPGGLSDSNLFLAFQASDTFTQLYDNNGNIINQKSIAYVSPDYFDGGRDSEIKSNDKIARPLSAVPNGLGRRVPGFVFLDNTNAVEAVKSFNVPASGNSGILGLTSDSSNNLFFTTERQDGTSFLIKLDSSNNISFAIRTTTSNQAIRDIQTDSNGDLLASDNSQELYKISNTGTVISARIQSFNEQVPAIDLELDSANNLYWVGNSRLNGDKAGIASADSAFNVRFSKSFNTVDSYPTMNIAIDDDDNIYTLFDDSNFLVLAKLNASGVLQWIRNIKISNKTISTLSDNQLSIAVDGSILVAFSDGSFPYFMKLNPDGSGEGTYPAEGSETLTYEASSITLSNVTNMSFSTISLFTTTESVPTTNLLHSVTTTTLTQQLTEI